MFFKRGKLIDNSHTQQGKKHCSNNIFQFAKKRSGKHQQKAANGNANINILNLMGWIKR